MKRLSRRQRVLGFLVLAVLVLLLVPFAAVQVQESIFRHRAEQLLADMRSLMIHKAQLPEIRAVFERWHPSRADCVSYQCRFECDVSYDPFTPLLDYSTGSRVCRARAMRPT
jgi:hypothetical protein